MTEKFLILFPGETARVMYWCLGCNCEHNFNPKIHNFNNDVYNPTVSPSLLHTGHSNQGPHHCHSYITNGQIQYLGDCQHNLKGQTIELPEVRKKLIEAKKEFYFDNE